MRLGKYIQEDLTTFVKFYLFFNKEVIKIKYCYILSLGTLVLHYFFVKKNSISVTFQYTHSSLEVK